MTHDSFANYDQWLEAPYQQMQLEREWFEDWCESNDLDPDGEGIWDAYQEWCADQGSDEPNDFDFEEPDWDEIYYNELP